MKIKQVHFNLNSLIKLLVASNLVMILVVSAVFGLQHTHNNGKDPSKKHNSALAIINVLKSSKGIDKTETGILKSAVKLTTTKVEKTSKIAYLSFDDGPSRNTADILNILKAENVKASFFVNGHTDNNSKKMYKLILENGNIIGNHTYSHNYKYLYSSVSNFKKDVNKLNKYVKELTGKEPLKILRFPGGSNNRVSWKYGGKNMMKKLVAQAKEMGYDYVDWNVDSEDATAVMIPKTRIINTVLRECKGKKEVLILMHDASPKKTTVEALKKIITTLKNQGYSFDTVDHMTKKIQFRQ